MNFDLLPTEIKRKIFHINRQDALNKKYKRKYDLVMEDLKCTIEELPFYFDLSDYCDNYDENDEEISVYILAYLQEVSYLPF
tara:strand:- start:8036 stop:8281 length:246 start_codon:yes stop_codon:yes gene_type:complete